MSDDEPSASRTRNRVTGDAAANGREGLDTSNLISPEEASKHFRKAERKRTCRMFYLPVAIVMCNTGRRQRALYAYPPSPSSSPSNSASRSPSPTRHLSLPGRLRALQAELVALEAEMADPSNPALQPREKGGETVDPGEMIRGLVDVRKRLEKVRNAKEGRGRLIDVVSSEKTAFTKGDEDLQGTEDKGARDALSNNSHHKDRSDLTDITEMDKRVGELEKLIGSVNVTLHEVGCLISGSFPLLTAF